MSIYNPYTGFGKKNTKLDKILINNKRLKEIRLYSCKGAAGGRVASISYILWKKTKADIYIR